MLDTQTVLLRTWRLVSASREIPIRPAAAVRPKGARRKTRRALLRPLVLSVAVLAAAGAAVGFTLSGRPAPDSAPPTTTLQATAAPAHHHQATPAPHPEASRSRPRAAGPKASPTRPAQAGSATTAAASTAAAASAAAPPAPGLPVLLAGGYSGRDPSQLTFAADGSNSVTGLTWSSWTATGASGSGRADVALCLPSCVGTPASLVPTTITLSDPVNGHFTQLTESRAGSAQSWNYPGNWPQPAS